MARLGKPLADLHISFADLANLTPADLLAIDGPKFIIYSSHRVGQKTLAVLISPDKWRTLNHNLPEVDPEKTLHFYVGDQAYVVIPCDAQGSLFRPKESTGLEIISRPKPRKKPAA